MATLLNGRALATELRRELREKITKLSFTPTLGVILVGDDPASHLYVSLKEKAAAEVGIRVEKVLLPADSPYETVQDAIQKFNQRDDVHGILVQLPLPAALDEHKVIAAMEPQKDADGFHPQNLAAFVAGHSDIAPGVSLGIMKLIELAGQKLAGKTAALLVNSQEFAQPLQKLLRDRAVSSVAVDPHTTAALLNADIVIVALGRPNTVTSGQVKDGTILIDVGTNKVGSQVVGDIDAASFATRDVYLTPVPGGVGPMTVVMLLWNVYQLALRQQKLG